MNIIMKATKFIFTAAIASAAILLTSCASSDTSVSAETQEQYTTTQTTTSASVSVTSAATTSKKKATTTTTTSATEQTTVTEETTTVLETTAAPVTEPPRTEAQPVYAPSYEQTAEYFIPNFPIIYQSPELPTGCEITAATMLLRYYGYGADKVTMARNYLPTLYDTGYHYGSDGRLYGNDMESYFIGDPFSSQGIICGVTAIHTAITNYFSDTGVSAAVQDITGTSLDDVYGLIKSGTPVMVWVTVGMRDRWSKSGWYRDDGAYMEYDRNDHAAVLIGYSGDRVFLADPIAGNVSYGRAQFEKIFTERGNKCLIIN